MTDWQTTDFFFDESLVEDPYPYFEELRSECPVLELPHLGVVAVTGYDETCEVYRDNETFSSCNSVIGPFATFPVPLEGDDVNAIVDRLPRPTPDARAHGDHGSARPHPGAGLAHAVDHPEAAEGQRGVRLAPRRSSSSTSSSVTAGASSSRAYTQPFAMLVVADLLGVPEEDHQRFREGFGLSRAPGEVGAGEEGSPGRTRWPGSTSGSPSTSRTGDASPARMCSPIWRWPPIPTGPTPEVTSVVRTSTFLFAAGQETSARLLAAALKHLAEHPELQDELRADRDLIPNFLEEVLRVESPVKADFRLARRTTSIGGVEVAAGTPVMLLNGAANRDPRHFECPAEFRADRPNAQSHVAFGRGAHSCPGGPLARAEGRISIERMLDRTRNIRLSEEHHGPPDARHFQYEPTWILRGLSKLHLEFDDAQAAR